MNYPTRPPVRRPRPAARPMPEPAPAPIPAMPVLPVQQTGLLAIASIPFQVFGETYPREVALCKGTIFPCLDLPYRGGGPC